jgi:hypothetical protein
MLDTKSREKASLEDEKVSDDSSRSLSIVSEAKPREDYSNDEINDKMLE